LAVALDAKRALLRCHHYGPIQHSHFTEGLKARNWNHGYVADLHADGHTIYVMKHGNVTLA
jgi:hypothetical protein